MLGKSFVWKVKGRATPLQRDEPDLKRFTSVLLTCAEKQRDNWTLSQAFVPHICRLRDTRGAATAPDPWRSVQRLSAHQQVLQRVIWSDAVSLAGRHTSRISGICRLIGGARSHTSQPKLLSAALNTCRWLDLISSTLANTHLPGLIPPFCHRAVFSTNDTVNFL